MITSPSTYYSKEYLTPFTVVPTRNGERKHPFFLDLLHTSNGEQTCIKDI